MGAASLRPLPAAGPFGLPSSSSTGTLGEGEHQAGPVVGPLHQPDQPLVLRFLLKGRGPGDVGARRLPASQAPCCHGAPAPPPVAAGRTSTSPEPRSTSSGEGLEALPPRKSASPHLLAALVGALSAAAGSGPSGTRPRGVARPCRPRDGVPSCRVEPCEHQPNPRAHQVCVRGDGLRRRAVIARRQ